MGKKTNIADGNDRVAVQAGTVHGRKTPKPAKPAKPADAEVSGSNVRSGNARVGRQADVITGGIVIRRR